MTRETLRALVEAATPGPWELGSWSGHCLIEEHGKNHPGPPRCEYTPVKSDYGAPHLIRSAATDRQVTGNYGYEEGGVIDAADAAFIAASRTVVPLLLAVADAAAVFADVENPDDVIGVAADPLAFRVLLAALAALEAAP